MEKLCKREEKRVEVEKIYFEFPGSDDGAKKNDENDA
jgi:hypothetical protein